VIVALTGSLCLDYDAPPRGLLWWLVVCAMSRAPGCSGSRRSGPAS